MPVEFIIRDGWGSENSLKIGNEGEITFTEHPHPPKTETETSYPFRQYFTTTGLSTGDNDMIVDGSSTPQEFSIIAGQDRDYWIKSISVLISDPGAALNEFGALSALTNGVDLRFQNQDIGTVVIANEIKTNLDFIRLGTATGSVGTGTDAYKLDIAGGGGQDSYMPVIDMTATFGFKWGLRLRKGTTDKIFFNINDALAGIATFNVIGYGIQV